MIWFDNACYGVIGANGCNACQILDESNVSLAALTSPTAAAARTPASTVLDALLATSAGVPAAGASDGLLVRGFVWALQYGSSRMRQRCRSSGLYYMYALLRCLYSLLHCMYSLSSHIHWG